MKRTPKWISKQAVLAFHERLLAEHGGAPGLLDEGLLDAALCCPMNQLAYEQADIFRLAAAYAYALTQNHPFVDGNKRVALTVAGVFLELNGYRLDASEQDAANATLALSTRTMNERDFGAWLRTSSSILHRRRQDSAKRAPRTPRKKK